MGTVVNTRHSSEKVPPPIHTKKILLWYVDLHSSIEPCRLEEESSLRRVRVPVFGMSVWYSTVVPGKKRKTGISFCITSVGTFPVFFVFFCFFSVTYFGFTACDHGNLEVRTVF